MGTDPDETDLSVRAKGQRVAGFELVQRIDTGANNAFGEVWLAKRLQPFQRVAIKFLRRDRLNEEMVERFSRAESKALARFNHPYIARFYELGFHGPVPYLVMQYVPGDRITAYADRHGLAMSERLRLMAKVCDAVQHVHLQGVVHRDLKPANILVSESRPEAEGAQDGEGRARSEEDSSEGRGPIPVLIDFGLAKSSNPDAPLTSAVVSRGGMIGSPAYASPEQVAARNPEDTGQSADIYALGAVLFELLVGISPMEHVLSDTTLSDPERLSRLAKDDRPSMAEAYARLTPQRQDELAKMRGIGVAEMRRLLRSRLAHLADRALRHDPGSRFSDARALALDIGNYLADRDYLEAAAEPRVEKWRRAVRRNRGFVAAACAVLAALVVGLGLAAWQWRVAVSSEQLATAQLKRSTDLLGVISMGRALGAALKNDRLGFLREHRLLAEIGHADRFPARLAVAIADNSVLSLDWVAQCVTFSPDGGTIATGDWRGNVQLWDASTGKASGDPLRGHQDETGVRCIRFYPDGSTLAILAESGALSRLDVRSREVTAILLGELASAMLSDDGRLVAGVLPNGDLKVWETETGTLVRSFGAVGPGTVCFSPMDVGWGVAVTSDSGVLRLFSLSTGQDESYDLLLTKGSERRARRVTDATSSPGGSCMAWCIDGSVVTLDRDESVSVLKLPLGEALSVRFSPDGGALAVGSSDGSIHILDAKSQRPVCEPLRGNGGPDGSARIPDIGFAPDGRSIAAACVGARVWDLAASSGRLEAPSRLGPYLDYERVVFRPDGEVIASAEADGTVRLWDALTGKQLGVPVRWGAAKPGARMADGRSIVAQSLAFASDGGLIATDGADVLRYDVASGMTTSVRIKLDSEWSHSSAAFSRDGRLVALGYFDGSVRVWDTVDRKPVGGPMNAHADAVTSLCFSPDAALLVSGDSRGFICVCDPSTGKVPFLRVQGFDNAVGGLAFSPDGRLFAGVCGASDGPWCDRIRVWDSGSGASIGSLSEAQPRGMKQVSFSPEGETLASAESHGVVRLWDMNTIGPIGEPLCGQDRVKGVAFNPRGLVLAGPSAEGKIRIWHAVPARERVIPIRERMAKVARVRSELSREIAAVGPAEDDVGAFQRALLSDRRFQGDLQTPALIVVGEVSSSRE